jgi:hypothetical protein
MPHTPQYPATSIIPVKGDVVYGTVGVTSAATLITAANGRRVELTVQNLGTANVYLGTDNTVTTSKGLLIPGTASMTDTTTTATWYGIVASGTVVVSYMEVY